MGQPLVFDRLDQYRLCLAQHRRTVKMNADNLVVVHGSRRIGLLSRRPLPSGEMINQDDECQQNPQHWSRDSKGTIVTASHRGLKKEWVSERHCLPLQRPDYNEKLEKLLDCDYGDPAPLNDAAEDEVLQVGPGFFSEHWQLIEKSHLAQKQIREAAPLQAQVRIRWDNIKQGAKSQHISSNFMLS